MLQYVSVITVTNGVLLTEANIGRRVEFRSVMQDLTTGNIHRVVDGSGYYAGSNMDEGMMYAIFERGYIGDRFQAVMGWPLAFFTPESRGIDVDSLMQPRDILL